MKKILIIVLFQNLGEEMPWRAKMAAPPLPGLLVAGLTPPVVEVDVLHEVVRPIDYATDADCIALSFMDYCAPHAFEVADRFRSLGKTVIAGGLYATTNPDDVQPHVDCVVVGEAEKIWPQVVHDYVGGRLKERYKAPEVPPLDNTPSPRYDLAERKFSIPIVTEATRGCPFNCSFCQLSITKNVYRMRPIPHVIRDLKNTRGLPWYKRHMVMFHDNNFGGNVEYAKELMREMTKLDLWAWGALFSFNCLHDNEFVTLLEKSNCRMAFLGMESLNHRSLAHVNKTQNHVGEYQELFERLRRIGVLGFAGLIFGLDEDTNGYFRTLPQELDEISPELVFMSIAIPIPGTRWHRQVAAEGRIFDHDLAHYEGDHIVFRPKHVTPNEVVRAYRVTNRRYYRWRSVLGRWLRFIRSQPRWGRLPTRVARGVLTSAIYFQLSIFMRHHARVRVLKGRDPEEEAPRSGGLTEDTSQRAVSRRRSCVLVQTGATWSLGLADAGSKR